MGLQPSLPIGVECGEATACARSVCCSDEVNVDAHHGLKVLTPHVEVRQRFVLAIVRHGERMDAVEPRRWYRSKDGQRFPFDPPLTERGRSEVATVASEVADKSKNATFSVVVSSPFARCVQTAVEFCRAYKGKLCIDWGLGEVFSPDYFGSWLTAPPCRTAEEVLALVPKDVSILSEFVGEAPTWPETFAEGRLRLISRVEVYAERAVRTNGTNFLLVTHGDCIAACLGLALSGAKGGASSCVVKRVDYCAHVVLERCFDTLELPVGLVDKAAGWEVRHGRTQLHNDIVWDPDGLDRAEEAIMRDADALNAWRETRASTRASTDASEEEAPVRRPRRNSTDILTGASLRKRTLKALELQQKVETLVTDLLPDLPMGKTLSAESNFEEFMRLL
eukprot:TRINITY_DN26744_c0_g5_i2.p1 TRINITY_DN26744_c0_g5~~TRINITY_DN26744_c0_g5_i2.p1  ORF type:complete len:393 (-),score=72.49 TRINITY_DN26744_c0_g5_i2:25-1203(-)